MLAPSHIRVHRKQHLPEHPGLLLRWFGTGRPSLSAEWCCWSCGGYSAPSPQVLQVSLGAGCDVNRPLCRVATRPHKVSPVGYPTGTTTAVRLICLPAQMHARAQQFCIVPVGLSPCCLNALHMPICLLSTSVNFSQTTGPCRTPAQMRHGRSPSHMAGHSRTRP